MLTGVHRTPGRLRPLRRRLRIFQDERLEPRLHRDGHPLRLLWLALDPADHPVAQPTNLGLERTEQLPSADELLPAGEYLTAQQRAVGGRCVNVADRLAIS